MHRSPSVRLYVCLVHSLLKSGRSQKFKVSNATLKIYARPHIFHFKLECGQMPNVMAALPNIGGGLCSTPQSLADAHY